MKRISILILGWAAAAAAQTSPDGLLGIGRRMQQNAQALKQYSFKRRTEIEIKGHSRPPRVERGTIVEKRAEMKQEIEELTPGPVLSRMRASRWWPRASSSQTTPSL